MPQRTFSALDIEDFDTDVYHEQLGGMSQWTVIANSFSDSRITFSDSVTATGTNLITRSFCYLRLLGNFNFQNFPGIPLNALINNVKLRFAGTVNGAAHTSHGGTAIQGADGMNVSISVGMFGDTPFPFPEFFVSDTLPIPWAGQFETVNETTLTVSVSDSILLAPSEVSYDFSVTPLSYDDFVTNFRAIIIELGGAVETVEWNCQPDQYASGNGFIQITAVEMIVDYELGPTVGNDWAIETPGPVGKGDKVSIVSPADGGLEDVESIIVTDGNGKTYEIPKIDFWFWSPFQIIFYNPANGGGSGEGSGTDGPISITLVGPKIGTEFSGSVPMGSIESVFEDVSGIYRIVKGKPTDTLYNPDRSGETEIVEIPDPYFATGFVD